jgi:hypothetical protein
MKITPTMTKLIGILFFCCLAISCKTKNIDSEMNAQVDSENIIELSQTDINKNLKVTIKMDSVLLEFGEEIKINLEIKNQNTNTVKLLFQNPSSSFGPWATTGSLINLKTNSSKLKYANKAVLQSQIYSEED